MSHRSAQRALVRMLFDPAFVDAARRDPARVLADVEEPLRGQLIAVDPRAFRLDRLRRSRTASVLREEFPRSSSALTREEIEAFFSSTQFHQAIAEDAPLPLAFAAYLAEHAPSQALVEETAIAQARRAESSAPPAGHFAIASGIIIIPSQNPPHRLAIRMGQDVAVVEISLALYRVLQCLDRPRSQSALLADASARGLLPAEAVEALGEAVDGEIVVRG